MKSHAQVAVVGGGVVGCSVLYHLTKLGWKDVVLLERAELTSGSTWHAAGGMHTLNSDPNVAKLQGYTLNLYEEIERISGQSVGLHRTGGLYMAATPERLDFLKAERAKARYLGIDLEWVTTDELKDLNPLIDPKGLTGVLYDPADGHVDPSGVTQAYAKAARLAGAEVYRHCPVVEMKAEPDGGWRVVTPKGSIKAEIVVNAGGLWARELGAMVGLHLPLLPMEHQYLLTEDLPEVSGLERELTHAIDFEGESYFRQEGKGVLLGTYEQSCVPWSLDGTPADFDTELLENDLDRIADNLSMAFARYPALAQAGIKKVINGPFTFAPDGNPLVGPVPGLRNYFCACGVMAGFSQGGGVGLTLAEWIIEGEPSMDVFAMDVTRFGDWASSAYAAAKVQENYRRRFAITFPNEELSDARPLRTSPVYERFKAAGAVFGAAYGLEHALWFAPEGQEAVETPTFRRSNAFEPVGEEVRALRSGVGLWEITNYAKYEITGPEAEPWLGGLLANRLPAEGRLLLSPMLSPKGRLMGDFTVARLGPERFFIFGSGVAERFHLRWFGARLPERGVDLQCRSSALAGFAIAGPKSRELLSRLTRADVSAEAFRFFQIREMDLGLVRCLVARISFSGDLGFEIYVQAEQQLALYDAILVAGEDLDLKLIGGRALNALRLEKSFGSWTREFTPDYTLFESGLDRFADLARNQDFVGREAALAQQAETPRFRLGTLAVEANGADAWANETVWHNGEMVGFVTSGGYGHHVGTSIALAYLPPSLAEDGTAFEVEILGERRPARFAAEALFDPKGERMRK